MDEVDNERFGHTVPRSTCSPPKAGRLLLSSATKLVSSEPKYNSHGIASCFGYLLSLAVQSAEVGVFLPNSSDEDEAVKSVFEAAGIPLDEVCGLMMPDHDLDDLCDAILSRFAMPSKEPQKIG